ncbi:secreted protein [Streptomyces davaonensis JCM 4913]|uniref:Secreted protein n=1 Tax=Streptomyces davaonensis (strain DSM 101723 / JCM 4913 / KCC S-0913 / 768) TaxID=1214101 RepID=K4R5U5_STRDJ|nr:hypothetical protein [Streptomyces davaonensis]CCK28723.1 secreted protein [Streptomyces davaonensis JCM 4913]
MPRPPVRVLAVPVLALGVLLTATACGGSDGPDAAAEPASASASPGPARTGAAPSPASAPALTEAQAQAALITEADLGEPWAATQGAATWRDGMLKASTERADCRRLLDTLYTEEFFGPDARTRAVTGLDDDWDGAQIRYQVVAHPPREADRTLDWLRSLPRKCGEFTAVTATGEKEYAEVTETELPEEAGDARQGLRITLTVPTSDDDATTLTLDLAAVRVGDDAIVLTNGGLGDVPGDATWAATEIGARRLAEVHKQGRVEV